MVCGSTKIYNIIIRVLRVWVRNSVIWAHMRGNSDHEQFVAIVLAGIDIIRNLINGHAQDHHEYVS